MNAIAPSLLAVEGVGHAFGGFRVLSSVSFDVPHGGLVGLIGPNGSGKTTLFNIICGFIHPLAGKVLFDGHALKSSNVVQRSRQGLVRTFQTPRVFEHLTVLENVMAGLYKCSQGGSRWPRCCGCRWHVAKWSGWRTRPPPPAMPSGSAA